MELGDVATDCPAWKMRPSLEGETALGRVLICPQCGTELRAARPDPPMLIEAADWTESSIRRGGPWRLKGR